MSYSNNPLLPKARADAVRLVTERHLPMGAVARRFGVHRSTVWRWYRRWLDRGYRGHVSPIETRSSRPHTSPTALATEVVERIRAIRSRYGRCGAIVHAHCRREGIAVSLASVKRVLKRLGLLRPVSKWKRYRMPVSRPAATSPGSLLQADVVHFVHPISKQRTYLYTLIDLHSRWAYAQLADRINQRRSWRFIQEAQRAAPFAFRAVQSDNGGEFGKWFHDTLRDHGMTLRHSRVRKPNDNAHIERFNRTIQDECLGRYIPERIPLKTTKERLTAFLDYYNNERLHLGLQCSTPMEVLQRS